MYLTQRKFIMLKTVLNFLLKLAKHTWCDHNYTIADIAVCLFAAVHYQEHGVVLTILFVLYWLVVNSLVSLGLNSLKNIS